jgi:hypothetical protein
MALQGALHLDLEAVIGRDKFRRHQQQHDVGAVYVVVDYAGKLVAGDHPAVMPCFDGSFALQSGKMRLQPVPQVLVLVRIRKE